MKKNIEKFLYFLVYSNLYLALGGMSCAYLTMTILQVSIKLEPLLITFFMTWFLYSLNRLSDMKEDKINNPERVKFFHKYGKYFLYTSGAGYFILAFSSIIFFNIYIFIHAIIPMIIALGYSFFRLKKYLLLKDIIVAVVWGNLALLTSAYYGFQYSTIAILIFTFIFLRVMVTTIMFDIKDIKGDKVTGVNTLPVRYGKRSTQISLYIINFSSIVFTLTIFRVFLQSYFVYFLLIPIIYSFFYVKNIDKYGSKNFFYGLVVDGELLVFAIISLVWVFIV